MAKAPAIGIDFGTSCSCVAVFQNGKVEIIPNDLGKRTTPSYVAFTDTERLIGDAAKNQVAMNPTNTIFDAQRLIGRKFEDVTVQSDMKYWPFQVVNDGGQPKLEAKYKGEKKTFLPEGISAMVLTKMKENAEAYIGKKVTDAVITIPAYFNYSQREATRDAATIAGFNALKIITAPEAAAIAYVVDKNVEKRNILIFDLGGCTCNVSVLTNKGSRSESLHTSGGTHFGGDDFDNRMVSHFVQEFEKKFEKDLTTNKRALCRLHAACERAKITLSSSTQASIEIHSLFGEIDLSTSITRARFESINADLFRASVDLVEKSLSDAKMDKAQIHDIVLVGGSSRIPKIQKRLRDFFNGKELNTSMNPDEFLAYGASIQGAFIHGDKSKELQHVILYTVTPSSLGIETAGGSMTVLIKRHTAIPIKQTQTFSLPVGLIQVYQGECAFAKDNRLVGRIDLTGILPALCGVAKVEVTFDIDAFGTLNVTAIEKSTGKERKLTINHKGRLSKKETERMVNEAEKYRTDDQKQRDRVSAKNSLESYCFSMKSTIEDTLKKYNDIIRWLDANPLAKKEEFENKRQELEQACNPIIREMYGGEGGAPPNSAAGYSGTRAKRSRLSLN